MAVNLDTLSISLNSFDAASDGEFNIGHIKLISKGHVEPAEVAVQDLKLEGIDDDEIEGNLNIDEIEGNI